MPIGQSELLVAALKQAGMDVTFHVVPDNGHGGPGFWAAPVTTLMNEFFDRHLKGR